MTIDLKMLLSRNRKTLEQFCKNNSIKSYDELVDHCASRKILPCAKEEYEIEMLHDDPGLLNEETKTDVKTKKPRKRRKRTSKASSA